MTLDDDGDKQKLIDIMFEMVLATTNDEIFCKRSRGERMAWVANKLRGCGFDTHPIGMSWGVLVSRELREKYSIKTDNLDN